MAKQIITTRDSEGRTIAEVLQDLPLKPEQIERLASRLGIKLQELDRNLDEVYTRELEKKRQQRLEREAWESLTQDERREFESMYGANTLARKAFEKARQEADYHWEQAEQERQHNELLEWEKTQSGGVGTNARYKKIVELARAGEQRTKERLAVRSRRELEAEIHQDEHTRLWHSMDAEEQKIFKRVLDEEPTTLERLQQFKAERRNPIEGIDNPRELYRLATSRPVREEFIEPTSNIEKVNDPRMLYKMALRDEQEKRTNKQK